MRRLAYFVAFLVGCGPHPVHDTPPRVPPPAADAAVASAEVPIADDECRQLQSHAVDLAAAAKGSAATEEVIADVKAQMTFDCTGMTRAQWKCGMGATTIDALGNCDNPP